MTESWPAGATLRLDEPLSRHTPLRLGGPADAWVVVHRRAALGEVLDACRARSWKVTPLGSGSRVLFRDSGMSGAVVRLGTDFANIEGTDEGLRVGAATPVPALVAACASAGLAGVDALTRIPGSFGAALKCEQGPWDSAVHSVSIYSRGKEQQVTLEAARRGRSIITGATLQLAAADSERLWHAVRASLGGRRAKDMRAPGCWWKPLQRRALRPTLVKAGLAGVRLRGIAIPEQAPETFSNLGGGTAEDLALLQRSAVDRVKRDSGETLSSRVVTTGRSRRTR